MKIKRQYIQPALRKRKWLWPIAGFFGLVAVPFLWLRMAWSELGSDGIDAAKECIALMTFNVED